MGRSVRSSRFRTVYDAAILAVHRNGERVSVFAGLDHTQRTSGAKVSTPSLAEQVDRLIGVGRQLLRDNPEFKRLLSDLAEPAGG